MEGTCRGIRVEIEDDSFCEPGSAFLLQVALAVVEAVAETTGINIDFFVNGETTCESRRELRNGRLLLDVKSITSKYTCELDRGAVDGVKSTADLKAEIKKLNGDKKDEFEEELKRTLAARGIDIASEFNTNTDAQESQELTNDNSDDNDWHMYLYFGLGAAAIVGVVALVGYSVTRKSGRKSGSGSDQRSGNDMVGKGTFEDEFGYMGSSLRFADNHGL